ncbi:MAG: tetratricopeptide repeat protein [Candidatus Latescibacterota bacterium]|nr:MAG: tetratricopeptide repeat protein [Candidatus Latescibacterota bacterium]
MTGDTGVRYKIAVLYFDNPASDVQTSHISFGISEDILHKLTRIACLDVVSRADVLPCRGRDVDTCELGRCMGVDYLLEGRIESEGGNLEVVTKLIDVGGDCDVWEESIECFGGELLAVPAEVTLKIADTLKIGLAPEERAAITRPATTNFDAYESYMRGREFLSMLGKANNAEAVRALEIAIELDDQFAAAYLSLGEAYSNMYTFYDSDIGWLAKTEAASTKAITIDPGMVEARFHLGIVQFHKRNFDEAKNILNDVIRMRPQYYQGHRWLGIIADLDEDYDAALAFYQKCAELKPCSVEPWLYMNMTHRRKGDMESATYAAKRFLEVGMKTLELIPDDPVTLSRFSVIYTLFGDRDKAYNAVSRILVNDPDDGLVLYNCAATFALLDDVPMALECLRKALASGYKNIREWINSDPDFDDLRKTQEFKDLLKEFDLLFGG